MNILDYKRKARGYTFREDTGDSLGDMGQGIGTSTGEAVSTGYSGNAATDAALAGLSYGGNSISSGMAGEISPSQPSLGGAGLYGFDASGKSNFQGGWDSAKASQYSSTLGMAPGMFGLIGRGIGYVAGGLSGYQPADNMYSDKSSSNTGEFSGGPGGGSDLAGALLLAGGITAGSGATAGAGAGTGAGAANPADPFAPYRSNLAKQYADSLAPGASSNIQAMPGYSQYNTGVVQPAMMAAQRAAATGGNLYGGGEKARLQALGQQGYYNFMNDYTNRLERASGATNNPATAVQLSLEAARDAQRIQDANQRATMSNLGFGVQTFNQLGGFDTIKNLFKGSSTPYSSNGWQNTSTDIYGQSGNTPWWLQSSGDGYSYY